MSHFTNNKNQNDSLEDSIIYMKNLIINYLKIGLYSNALFYADKIFYLSLNKDMPIISDHLYDLAQCFFLNKEYYRCVNLIQKYNMTNYNIKFLNLLGQALLASEDYEAVITYLDKDNIQIENMIENEDENFYHSIRLLIVAKAYEIQENKPPAIRNYIKALQSDPGNIEAFESLINHQLLSAEQKERLKVDLNFNKDNKWLYDYYLSKMDDNIYMTANSDVMIIPEENINGNIIDILYNTNDQDLMKIEAEKYFTARDYENAYKKLKKINDEDFYKFDVIPMYCACMIEMNKTADLYYLAHKLANSCSDRYVSWFAVGSYYYLVKKYELARKYFVKCNQLNKNFPEGWIALGNSYAAQDESDQALSAYRTCLRLFPGCHQANLYIGMEFIRTNNLKTALVAFQDALMVCNKDPLIYNEIGLVFYKQRYFEEADSHFKTGLDLCGEDMSLVSQTLTANRAHALRKLRKFDECIELYNSVIKMDVRNFSIITALAYSFHLKGDFSNALDFYHKANFIKSDDTFVIEMINKCLNDMLDIPEI